jgi:imidazolonepropionase-like amidohydrolase
MKTKIFLPGPVGRRRGAAWVLAACGAAALAPASTNILPAAKQQKPVLLSGGTVVTVSGEVLERGDVLFSGGKITAVGPRVAAPAGAEVIDVRGRRVYPGLISAYTQLGLAEVSSARQTIDTAEINPINPNARAQIALNPDSDHLPVTRANGVLTALSVPGARGGGGSNLLAGSSVLIRLDGWTWEELTLKPAVAMHVYWPEIRSRGAGRGGRGPAAPARPADTGERALDEAFAQARAYARAKAAGGRAPETDLRWEAMGPVLRGEQKLFVHANEVKQIRAALAWAKRQELKITIVGGLEAWRVAEELRAAEVPVIIAGTDRLPPRRDDDFESAYANPARLHAAGVRFCIAGEGPGDHGKDRNLGIYAARAAAHGLTPALALRAVTLSAAELLGVESELGSIEVGKRATLIVTEGDPLEPATPVKLAFIDGAKIDLQSRHTQLYEKYRERLRRTEAR